MANHQIYPDWIYLWAYARHLKKHGDVKVLLMAVLKYMPLLGWGMQFFEFIFLERKWVLDRDRMTMYLQRAMQDCLPLWLLIFPEGTLNTPNNRETSEKYAKKMGITDTPEFVILPKSTGLFHCAHTLSSRATHLFDLTVAYSGIKSTDIPYESYLVENVFFKGMYPKEIHIHVRRFQLSKIPGLEATEKMEDAQATFNQWLRRRFMVKDGLLAGFYKNSKFVEEGVAQDTLNVSLSPDSVDWAGLLFLWVFTLWSVPFYWGSCIWMLKMISLTIWKYKL